MQIGRKKFVKNLGQLTALVATATVLPVVQAQSQQGIFSQQAFRSQLKAILAFWQKHAPDTQNGGFIGAADRSGHPDYSAPKGLVIHARILWTFARALATAPSSASRASYTATCECALAYIIQYFWDHTHGGLYWSLHPNGTAAETRKLMYGHSFCLYAASEYARVTGSKPALKLAQDTFSTIITKAYDPTHGGYIEAYAQDWSQITDYILCQGDSRKSMNTHLHLLESFANLYRIDKSEAVRYHLQHCLNVMLQYIIGPGKQRMALFFTETWQPRSTAISYGHDIEAAWLLYEAAHILGHQPTLTQVKQLSIQMAHAAAEGLQHDHGMIYEFDPPTAHTNHNRDWWVQAEAMVGFMNAYTLSGQPHFLQKAKNSWAFINNHLIDSQYGEWYTSVTPSHQPTNTNKITLWKCPYHNARACMEMIARL
jgi:cellobiose epimerase